MTYGGELRIEAPDMTGYNLMNAREKIDAELKSGLYTYGGETVEKWQLYQSKLREVLAGVNTYWLDKPLQTAFQQRHTVTLEGGDEALRYRMYVVVGKLFAKACPANKYLLLPALHAI